MRMMKKPRMQKVMRGVEGNQWEAYDVEVEGKVYHHQDKKMADIQFNAAQRVYDKAKKMRY